MRCEDSVNVGRGDSLARKRVIKKLFKLKPFELVAAYDEPAVASSLFCLFVFFLFLEIPAIISPLQMCLKTTCAKFDGPVGFHPPSPFKTNRF